ncbi:Nicotinamidase-related amidase [Aliiroseovarius halocynthiae]|uniref:Cysteine hydrolase n=1 Tax=Aliiroseovarius halocynthiae TaxID=985055 RepID=A0A545SYG4_9RHOB|nr:isochorismatase family cysteine hydrolase [Aliiroseovarius halocynthiae]TQV70001.1 cysteine hydrolase [Aliiroseovarius halocynthiae]SMR70668.1 Nicotinamidase-related amidase [Aliiroseovarius halocynthiae]
MMYIWAASIIVIAAFLWALLTLRRIGIVTQGQPIEIRPGTALLLIDLQEDFWNGGQYSEEQKAHAALAISEAAQAAEENGFPVVVIRQEWSQPSTKAFAKIFMKGQGIAGHPGTQMAAPFAQLGQHEVVKRVQDGFETGSLDTLLAQLNIGHLQIAGLDTAFCVNKTAQAALARGYKVSLISDGLLGALPKANAKARDTLEKSGAQFI